MIELGEKEGTEEVAEKEAAETAAHVALMKEANLEVIPRSRLYTYLLRSLPCVFQGLKPVVVNSCA